MSSLEVEARRPAAEVRLEEVSRVFGSGRGAVHALAGVSVRIAPGEAVALVGRSGSGKTTMLNLIGAMDRPSAGAVIVDGERIERLSGSAAADYRARVGFVFQHFHLIPVLSALENVLLPLIPQRRASQAEERARMLLERVGLGEHADALPGELSGGEQQRVALARALIAAPRLILADEPTGNLDSATRTEVAGLLLYLCRQTPATLLVATHDTALASLCDRSLRLLDGRIHDRGLSP